ATAAAATGSSSEGGTKDGSRGGGGGGGGEAGRGDARAKTGNGTGDGGTLGSRSATTAGDVSLEDDTRDDRTQDEDTDGESTVQSTVQSTQYTGTTGAGTSVQTEVDWLGYMRSVIFPRDTDAASVNSAELNNRDSETYDEDEDSVKDQDDEDGYLLQQALAAARAIHHVQGVEYDETQEINVLNDIRFVVVTVSLPLGLLFQEHEIGVWVSRVVPSGNGARAGVQHGDQLAAVDGEPSVHATVDEVAAAVSGRSSDGDKESRGVELTFLRYVGPLRPVPGSVIQEGFEVTDTAVSPDRKKGREKSKRRLFSKKNGSSSSPHLSSTSLSTRKFGIDISPRSPKRQHAATSRGGSSPKSASSSRSSSSKTSSSAPSIQSLNNGAAQQRQNKQNVHSKKKKSVRKLLPFKKK
ncbi:hypothetical protein ACHAWF_013131, partial [Thalassiosira exigua]